MKGWERLLQPPRWWNGARIVLEKPFGRDLESANALNDVVHGVFDETAVYRIDHYLGKETVQNILVFRFSNSLLRTGMEQELHRLCGDHRG